MRAVPAIIILDVGKTNKKCLVFNEDYKTIAEQSVRIDEVPDEDGFLCDDLNAIINWAFTEVTTQLSNKEWDIKAIHFTTYGASLVYLDAKGKVLTPLYNYLKPFPGELQQIFYKTYGEEEKISRETASPALGNLNSGLQLYRLKYQRPEIFDKLKRVLHLPNFLSYLFTKQWAAERTSIGCHTFLWNFETNNYHQWVYQEKLNVFFPEIVPAKTCLHFAYKDKQLVAGPGLHDSSAALIPYLKTFSESFVLLSTGTWSISLNPFNSTPLSADELKKDCLCYMNYEGRPVKASRLFLGNEFETKTKEIAALHNIRQDFYNAIDTSLYDKNTDNINNDEFNPRNYPDAFSAYLGLMKNLVAKQKIATDLVLCNSPVQNIIVDGGFAKNDIFMMLLAKAYPQMRVYAATMDQATALGSALAIHECWNKKDIPQNLINLRLF